jgi:predicted RNA-binding Zn ribbon-like protein
MQHQHPPALFLADAPGLDFLNSIATPVDTPYDWLADGDALLRWLAQAELVPPEVLDAIRAQALPGELDPVAAQARSLREWFRGFVQEHKGRPLATRALEALEPLNRLLERDEAYQRITPAPGGATGFTLQATRRWRSPESLLLPIGEALARCVCEEDFTRVKACEGPACTLLFADHTPRQLRRWCSMAICGNRAKQAMHRQRAKTLNARRPG